MATHLVTFRLHSGSDYSERWKSVVDKIHSEAANDLIWEETSAVVVLQSAKSAATLLNDIYMGSQIYETLDVLLVVNLSIKGEASYAFKGAKYPNTLSALMDAR